MNGEDAATTRWSERYVRYTERFGFGDFPKYVQKHPVAALHETRGITAHAVRDADGREVHFFRADEDAHVQPKPYDRDVYLAVIEGSFTVEFHADQLDFGPGREFNFPKGLPVGGRLKKGTRGILVLAG